MLCARPPTLARARRVAPRVRRAARDARGQATVELVLLLPCLIALLAALWQLALLGHAHWAAAAAARAAARAHAVGSDPARAARAHLAGSLEPGLRVSATDGDARVAVRVPRLPGLPSLGHVHATAHFEPQT
jgi:Flp pilus assembly protein TadG